MNEWRHALEACADDFEDLKKSQRVEFLPGKKKGDFRGSSWPDEFVRYGRRALVGLRADDVKAVSIEGLCLSPFMSSNLLT